MLTRYSASLDNDPCECCDDLGHHIRRRGRRVTAKIRIRSQSESRDPDPERHPSASTAPPPATPQRHHHRADDNTNISLLARILWHVWQGFGKVSALVTSFRRRNLTSHIPPSSRVILSISTGFGQYECGYSARPDTTRICMSAVQKPW